MNNREILVVDDDKLSLTILSDILKKAGYTVQTVSDGELALSSVKAKFPALIFLDIMLPGIDGYEVCRRLKESEDTKDIPVIFISGRTNPLDKVKAFKLGGVDYISKPLAIEEVLARVATHLAIQEAKKEIEEKNLQLQQEIKNRKLSEKQRKDVEIERTNLAHIIESSLNEIYVFDAKTLHFIYVNDGALKNIGHTMEEMRSMTPIDIKPELDEKTFNEIIDPLVKDEKEIIEFQTTHIRADGSRYPVEVHLQLIKDIDNPVFLAIILDITQRKHNEEILRASENRFKTTFNEAPLGIALIGSLTGHIYEVNPMFAKIAGRTQEEMATIDWMSITHPDDIQEDLDNMALLNAGKIDGFQMEKRYIRPDGSVVWINMTIAPVKVEDKTHPRHLCMIEDITERKQAERNQYILAEILGILNESISLTDAINNIIITIKQEMGFDAVGIRLQSGDDFPYFVHDSFSDDFLVTENSLLTRVEGAGICRDENGNVNLECTCGMVISGQTNPNDPNSTPGGSWWTNDSIPLLDLPASQDPRQNPRNRCIHEGFCSVALMPIRANQKNVGLLQFNDRKKNCFTPEMIRFFEEVSTSIGVALMRKQVVDMLEKHALELELNKKRLDVLLQLAHMTDNSLEEISGFVMNEGAKLTNSEFGFIGLMNDDETVLTIHTWSKHVMDTCGLSDEYPVFYTKEGGLWIEPLLQRKSVIINDYESTEFNKNGVPNGHIPLKRLINVPIFEGDKIVALVTMANKEEEYDENDVIQITLLLEGMWKIIVRKHDQEALKQYTKDLERSNELKSLFADIMRHDLLNPAGIVQGYTELLCDIENDEMKINYLNKIDISIKKLIDMIETTAKFAKFESVKDLEFCRDNIANIFRIVVDNFKPQIDNKQMTLEFKPEGPYLANVNPVIEEVFVNLLSNAIKYSPEKSKIIVDIIDAGDNWKVAVIDQGEGVLDEHKALLFERFQRVNKVAVKGSGLGLAIVKRIIELHGGDFGVEDNLAGVGSVFWVTVRKA
ncbi:MAG: PAS domain S-box protein [Methanosarcinaceae archaeon]|nr:PAS domain S-box protein [Methanosarcinaceae archaeon]